MTIVREQYFNGTSGVALDTTNTDYETFFGTARFSSTYTREGTTSAEFYAGTTATATYARYSFPETPVRYLSRYRQQALPSALTTMYRFRRVGTTQFLLRMSSTGLWSIADSASTIVATMTKPIVANQPYRLEIDVVNQVVTMRIYLGANIDSTTADDTISATLVFPSGSGSGAFDDYDEGFITARASYSVFVDAIRDGDTSNPGRLGVDSSTAATATAYPNQRKIDRTSNGVLWTIYSTTTGGGYPFRSSYSLDDGATWSTPDPIMNGSGSMGSTYIPNCSFFIDIDDYAHLATKDASNGNIYYRRGTPNAGRTAWTWSAPVVVSGTSGDSRLDYPDLVAFRMGTGWQVAIVMSGSTASSPNTAALYMRIPISADGTIGAPTADGLASFYTVGRLSNSYSGPTGHTFPSIDFNHTGDGKTVKDGAPHLYIAWSAGKTGTGFGIRFRKANFNGTTWSWNVEREIDSTRYYYDSGFLNCLFDGTAVIIGYYGLGAATPDTLELVFMERDVADTTTVQLLRINGNSNTFFKSSMTYDDQRNIYLVGTVNVSNRIVHNQWNRSTNKFFSTFIGTAGPSNSISWISSKRGYFSNKIEFVYTYGTTSPYRVTYGTINTPNPASESFFYTGANQTYVIPDGVNSVDIECWGASGEGTNGGLGGYSSGTLGVTPGESLTVVVAGGDGWPNAGNVGTTAYFLGGGSSDVRQGGSTITNQKIVAGGGGGGPSGNPSNTGGDGGGLIASDASQSTYGGKGGSQVAGGAGGTGQYNGASGLRNSGGTVGASGAGSGGGGYYGGGAGAYSGSLNYGGGGGSGYIDGVTNGLTQVGVNLGYGRVVITPGPAIPPVSSDNISVRLTTTSGTAGNSQPGTPVSSLGGYTSTTDALSGSGSIFDNITNNDNQSSTTDYRAIDILNTHADYSLKNVKLFLINAADGAYVTVAKDNAGAVSKSSSTQGASIPNETTAPTGVGAFVDATSGVLLGDIGPDQIIRVWLKRTVNNVPSMNNDGFLLYVEASGENLLNAYSSTAEGSAQTPTWGLPTQFSSATYGVSSEQAHSGTHSWKVTSSDYEGVGITPLGAPSTVRMRVDGWLYQASGSPQNIMVGGMTGSGYWENYPVLVPNAVWTYFSRYIPAGYDGIVVFPTDSVITFYMDDMVFMKDSIIGPPVAGGDELLTDSQRFGEVDDGSIWNWRDSTVSTAHPHSGLSSWSMVTSPTSTATLDLDGAVGTEWVTDWTWTGWMYQETGSNRTIEVTVEGSGTSDVAVTVIPSGVWTPFTISGTGQPLVLALYDTYPGNWIDGDVLYFDDMSFLGRREISLLTEYQRTASGPVSETWKTFSTGTPSVPSTTTYQTEPAAWTIPAPEWMKIDLSLPLVTWKFSGYLYQETGSDRDVEIGTDNTNDWESITVTIPSGQWTYVELTHTTDITDMYVSAQTGWLSGETLYFDDMEFFINSPNGNGITSMWSIEQIPWPRVSVWNGTTEVGASSKVWDGATEVIAAPEVT